MLVVARIYPLGISVTVTAFQLLQRIHCFFHALDYSFSLSFSRKIWCVNVDCKNFTATNELLVVAHEE